MEEKTNSLTDRFIEERKWLKNVTPTTIEWYVQSFKHFAGCATEADSKQRIVEMRQRGCSATSVNDWARCINAFLRWSGAGFTLPRLQEEEKILAMFTSQQVARLLSYHPRNANERRALVLAGLLLDTGIRVAEAVALQRSHIDMDNLLIKVEGKGRKQRVFPMSVEGRRRLYLWLRLQSGVYVFPTLSGLTPMTIRNAQKDITTLCRRSHIEGVRSRLFI